MTDREKFLGFIKAFDEFSYDVVRAKNADYSGSNPDPLRNFKISADIAGVTVEQGIMVRMADKMVRVSNLTSQKDNVGAVGEKLEDTLMDLAKYASILAYYCKETYNQEEDEAVEVVVPVETPPEVLVAKTDWWKDIFK